MRTSTQAKRQIERRVNNLTFADDISRLLVAILEKDNDEQQKQLNDLKAKASTTGLEINFKKTVQMRLNQPNKTISPLTIDGQPVEIVDEFKYLDSYMSSSEKDINSRIGLAWVTFDKLKNIFKSRTGTVSNSTKFRLFNAACISILLYGCESHGS
jgi:hypothetical protein